MEWVPKEFSYVIEDDIATSTKPVRVMSDAGEAMVKHINNPLGAAALVCELVGTRLAQWLGLQTFDAAIAAFPNDLANDGSVGDEAPAFVARYLAGRPWSGHADDLFRVVNRLDVAGLVVFDTWTRNRDRYWKGRGEEHCNLGNVFIADRGPTLLAIDHTECFKSGRKLGTWVSDREALMDTDIFGLFPGFAPYLERGSVDQFISRLASFTLSDATRVLREVPASWCAPEMCRALETAIMQRSVFVSKHFRTWLEARHRWQTLL